ncbi:MAG: right-handed parallel beta-helix repeat-containing protein, partial [Gammaproteobacteria bacterium]
MTLITVTAGVGVALALMVPVASAARDIRPDADLCAEISALASGQELVLAPGEYQGPCAIRRGGEPGAPLVIRGADPARPPRILYDGRTTNVFEVRASHVVIRGLEFGPTQTGVDAVRLFAANDVVVEDCRFGGLGGIAVVANHASLDGLTVRRNIIRDTKATAMYFGCHNGTTCIVGRLVVEGNYIRGVTAPDPAIGYGIEVKLNSSAVIRDNVIIDTKGPGIMVFGARELARGSLIERNVVIGSRTSSGIVVGGGPAVVRNNLALLNGEAGVGLEDYQRRALLRAITVIANTVYKNAAGGITAPEGGLRDVAIINNAAHAPAGRRVLPAPQPGLEVLSNVDCTGVPCFANPDGMDFSPFPGSLLTGRGVLRGQGSM